MKKNKIKNKKGFTIIEMMIAITVFLVVVIYGMQSLLNASNVHKKAQDTRSILDSLTFTLDDISKNLRTGYDYRCISGDGSFYDMNTPLSGEKCIGIIFKPADYNENTKNFWVYYIGNNPSQNNAYSIFKNTSGATYSSGNDTQITPNEVVIDKFSGFDILGAESLPDNTQQPLVTIRLVGKIRGRNNVITPFSIQTTVSQRLIDVAPSS